MRDPSLITAEEIGRTGATTAWEALRAAGTFLTLSEGRSGADARASHRGRSSFLLSAQVLVVIDDVVMVDVAALRDVRADRVYWIRILSGLEATSVYGSAGGNGAIVVKTSIRDSD